MAGAGQYSQNAGKARPKAGRAGYREILRDCAVEDCDRPWARYEDGFCAAHHARFVRTGDPQADRPLRAYRRRT
jgi:hypothetical protein